MRGEAVLIADEPDHVPIGLLAGATVERPVAAGETVRFADVSVPESLALRAWRWTLDAALAPAVASQGRPAAPPLPTQPSGRS